MQGLACEAYGAMASCSRNGRDIVGITLQWTGAARDSDGPELAATVPVSRWRSL